MRHFWRTSQKEAIDKRMIQLGQYSYWLTLYKNYLLHVDTISFFGSYSFFIKDSTALVILQTTWRVLFNCAIAYYLTIHSCYCTLLESFFKSHLYKRLFCLPEQLQFSLIFRSPIDRFWDYKTKKLALTYLLIPIIIFLINRT
jgi:hypothetical protein